mmetsp:Transcript_4944/g.22142  ORF Transcript_4944/g.22142 Transcript_4944/m.22142 type:complete len:255 (-) Transcript_4944:299-1063(-)
MGSLTTASIPCLSCVVAHLISPAALTTGLHLLPSYHPIPPPGGGTSRCTSSAKSAVPATRFRAMCTLNRISFSLVTALRAQSLTTSCSNDIAVASARLTSDFPSILASSGTVSRTYFLKAPSTSDRTRSIQSTTQVAIDSATGVGAKNRKPVLMFHFASSPPAKSTPKSHQSLASRGSGSNPTLISVSTSTTGRRLSRSIARISRPMSCFVHRYSPRWNTLQASPHRCFTRSHRSSDEARATNSIFECTRSVVK